MYKIHILTALCGISVLTGTILGDDVPTEVCKQWMDISHSVSGSGKYHNCTIRSNDCTVMDCTGATTFSHKMFSGILQNDININYCFGAQINPCNDPISMDFYLQIPAKNFSKTFRIFADKVIELQELNYPVIPGSAYPKFTFQFEKVMDNIHLSVRGKVVFGSYAIEIPDFDISLIEDQVITVKTCTKTIRDASERPLKSFAPQKCQLKPYTQNVYMDTRNPSETLNKSCELDHHLCGQREMCDNSLNPPVCICGPEFQLSTKGDACLSLSRYNHPCVNDDDCGYNEQCRNGNSKTLLCLCKEHHAYDTWRDICTYLQPGFHTEPTSAPSVKDHTPSAHDSQTDETDTSTFGAHEVAILVGGCVGAALFVSLVIFGVVCYKRRRPQPLSINDRESSAPLIGSDDSDNLIM